MSEQTTPTAPRHGTGALTAAFALGAAGALLLVTVAATFTLAGDLGDDDDEDP